MAVAKIISDENLMKRLEEQKDEIVTLENARVAHEKTILELQNEAKIRNMFIVNLHKSNIAFKLELGRKLTLDEIEFLKKSCT